MDKQPKTQVVQQAIRRAFAHRDDILLDRCLTEIAEMESQINEMRECYELVLKTARRCCRDLNHAIDNIDSDNQYVSMFSNRVAHYEVVLGGTTDYRNSLHEKIEMLERVIAKETF